MPRILSILLAVAPLALAGSAIAQPMPRNNPAAEQNVIESERYSEVLRTNPAFRAKRIQEECGPITDPRLREECVASFPPATEPMRPHLRRHPYHR
ncbi:MAG TPA: hypothetical protein VE993_13900 [Stellaceae bacterium]|nr:hypothetical protein [Stellaceae bacterium]